jgi:hypothetical protein
MEGISMIIRHSNSLLKQLSTIEDRLKKLQIKLKELGINWDQEDFLKVIAQQKSQGTLADKKSN